MHSTLITHDTLYNSATSSLIQSSVKIKFRRQLSKMHRRKFYDLTGDDHEIWQRYFVKQCTPLER